MLTKAQVCERLAVSRSTLERLLRVGDIPSYQIGGSIRFMEEDIDNYVRGCLIKTAKTVAAAPSAHAPKRGRPYKSFAPRVYQPGDKVV